MTASFTISYDILVIAVGSQTDDFGTAWRGGERHFAGDAGGGSAVSPQIGECVYTGQTPKKSHCGQASCMWRSSAGERLEPNLPQNFIGPQGSSSRSGSTAWIPRGRENQPDRSGAANSPGTSGTHCHSSKRAVIDLALRSPGPTKVRGFCLWRRPQSCRPSWSCGRRESGLRNF